MAAPIAVYTTADSPRLRYVLRWLLKEQLGLHYELVSYDQDLSRKGISYGRMVPGCIHIPDAGLLWENKIYSVPVVVGTWGDIPTIFAGKKAGPDSLPFDLFSAIFYLLSRYEEYLPFLPDRHGRYPATESILFQQGWLDRPLVDEWTEAFHRLLQPDVVCGKSRFAFQPTYDIDIAWSFRHKGPVRWMGGLLADIGQLNGQSLLQRARAAFGGRDPYDAYDWMKALHERYGWQPVFFILAAAATTDFDKNIPPSRPAMKTLVRQLNKDGRAGLHPSYYSGQSLKTLKAEKEALEGIIGGRITDSRQHFIRIIFPATCRALIEAGIKADYSMGYSTRLGFRAGTGRPFLWYDLRLEETTALRMFPFCFMDTTARFDLRLSVSAAFERLREMAGVLHGANSPLCTVFHNFSLGTDPGWKGWREAYASFVAEISGWE